MNTKFPQSSPPSGFLVRACAVWVTALCLGSVAAADQPVVPPFLGPAPGPAITSLNETIGPLRISNNVIGLAWTAAEKGMWADKLFDRITGSTRNMTGEVFVIEMADGKRYPASEMLVMLTPKSEILSTIPGSPRPADARSGRELSVEMVTPDYLYFVTWRARLRDHANYIHVEVEIFTENATLDIERVTLFDMIAPDARQIGTVEGSVVVDGNHFFAIEHPMGQSTVLPAEATRAEPAIRCSTSRPFSVKRDKPWIQRAVIGIAAPGQMRRAFLHYLESERAHPYRPFLHYNSWYDIAYFSKYNEADCLAVVKAYCEELVNRRGVPLDSLLFDDGWDDTQNLWKFHDGLPNGFTPVAAAAEACGAAPGVWLSPWGGYGDPRKQRLAAGAASGYDINDKGFVLSAPRYFQRFRSACMRMMRRYGVNHFKFDGIGRDSARHPGSPFSSDFDAAMYLISDLRKKRADVYINLTTGTWPSPFWLLHADSTWRGGHDHEFIGTGSERQKWMTYRDAMTYKNVVLRGPLYPLNSLMLHGVIYAEHARGLQSDPAGDLRAEIRTAFGCGTQLQELYVSPSLMTAANWDDLAAAARWWRERRHILVDVHWVGGDPEQLQIYGWAAWAPQGATLTLRNPSDKAQAIALDAATAFELPKDAPQTVALKSPYDDQRLREMSLTAGSPQTVELQPFEVVVFDATMPTTRSD